MKESSGFDKPLERCIARSIATSLFGGAILATTATASLSQTYVDSVSTLGLTTVPAVGSTFQYVVLAGYSITGDGGGGVLMPGPTPCTANGGTVFQDHASNCFYRANPTNSVREWGAKCDVVVGATGNSASAVWNPGSLGNPGTLVVDNSLLTPSPPKQNQYIVLSQVGGPTLWSSSLPAVSMTRFSLLGGSQSNYQAGDLISFTGLTSPGSFSQEAAIIVDAVSGGTITQWHFLWGGLYDPAVSSNGTFGQDTIHSHCANLCGTLAGQASGATMTPAWSGWSVLDKQSVSTPGSMYAVGDIVTLTAVGGGTVNGGHYPKLIVEGTTTSGGISAGGFDWIDYGSYVATAPPPSTTLVASGSTGMGTGLTLTGVGWARGPFATVIASATAHAGGTTKTDIGLLEDPPIQLKSAIQTFYYGDDDYGQIDNAIQYVPGNALVIPAACGTTQALNLSPRAAATNINPARNVNTSLLGANLQSSGIYALAYTPSARAGHPVMSRVIYSGTVKTTNDGFVNLVGGGFSNMVVEGLGLPEGYGYYRLAANVGAPSGYNGPTAGPGPNYTIPTSGDVVEIDAANLMQVDNVHIRSGGIGRGNSTFQCGLDESDPENQFHTASIANLVLSASRLDGDSGVTGPNSPDFVLRLGASCQGSVYNAVTAFDGIKADVLVYGGNLFSRVHINSGVGNASSLLTGVSTIPWTTPYFGLAGLADYGFYVIGNTSMSGTQCDVANIACVFTVQNSVLGAYNPGQITDTEMKCGSFPNVPSGYSGVKLSVGTANSAVSGTTVEGRCQIAPAQLVLLDQGGPVDASTSLCNNGAAVIAGCTGFRGSFPAGQFYTQPAIGYGNVSVVGNTLYAVPFFSPATGGAAAKLGLDVMGLAPVSPASQCEVGIYKAFGQTPTTLIVDGGTVPVTAMGSFTSTGIFSVQLAPSTPYFLVVGCNGSVTLEGVVAGQGLSIPLVGASSFAATSTTLSAVWSYTTLPTSFPTSFVARSPGPAPNVYVGPA